RWPWHERRRWHGQPGQQPAAGRHLDDPGGAAAAAVRSSTRARLFMVNYGKSLFDRCRSKLMITIVDSSSLLVEERKKAASSRVD
ncbi:unnamed protein product, partial [Heterosigma akashiwo]